MTCDWEAMMKQECAPANMQLAALSDTFSPRSHDPERSEQERREGVRLLEVQDDRMSIEEIICTETHCIALSYTVPRHQAQPVLMASDGGGKMAMENTLSTMWQHELRELLNASPGVVRALVRRHGAQCLHPTDEIEAAMVREVTSTALEVELTVIDLALIEDHMAQISRRTLSAQLPLPRECTSAEAVEDAIFKMLQLDPTDDQLEQGREMGI